jgi:hypothetical protein
MRTAGDEAELAALVLTSVGVVGRGEEISEDSHFLLMDLAG